MLIRKCPFTLLLGVLVLISFGNLESQATLIADPDTLVGYAHGARIDDAFTGMTLSAGARNWDSLGSWVKYCTGHVVNYQFEPGNYTIGWESGTHFPGGGIGYEPWGKFGSQYAANVFSADSIILVVNLDDPVGSVWVDFWNASGSSNNDISLKAYNSNQAQIGIKLGNIGPEPTRVQYTHSTPEIKRFTIDISGGFWSYPIDAVGTGVIPEPATLVLLALGGLVIAIRRRA